MSETIVVEREAPGGQAGTSRARPVRSSWCPVATSRRHGVSRRVTAQAASPVLVPPRGVASAIERLLSAGDAPATPSPAARRKLVAARRADAKETT